MENKTNIFSKFCKIFAIVFLIIGVVGSIISFKEMGAWYFVSYFLATLVIFTILFGIGEILEKLSLLKTGIGQQDAPLSINNNSSKQIARHENEEIKIVGDYWICPQCGKMTLNTKDVCWNCTYNK